MTDAVTVTDTTPNIDTAAIAAQVTEALKATQSAPVTPVIEAQVTVEPYVFQETGDAALDLSLEYLGNLGLTDEHPAVVSASAGDFTALEAYLEAKGEKGYQKYLKLAKEGVSRLQDKANAGQTAINTAVYGVVGSAENWQVVAKWARETATPEERADMNAMLKESPTRARIAAEAIFRSFNAKTGGFTKEPKNPVNQHGANGTAAFAPAKTVANRRELVAATNELVKRFGSHNIHKNPEYIALHAQYNNR